MIDDRVARIAALHGQAKAAAPDTTVTPEAALFVAAGERIRDELLDVAHRPKAEGGELIDQREMKSWIRHANTVLASPDASMLEAIALARPSPDG